MNNDFKNLDDWMMKAARGERDQKMSPEELKAFQASVIKKIAERKAPGSIFGMPAASMVFVFGLLFLLALSGAYFLGMQIGKTAKPSLSQAQQNSSVSSELSRAPLKDETLLIEVAVLRELGVWTDDDEQAIGIPLDALMQELDTYTPEAQPVLQIAGPVGR